MASVDGMGIETWEVEMWGVFIGDIDEATVPLALFRERVEADDDARKIEGGGGTATVLPVYARMAVWYGQTPPQWDRLARHVNCVDGKEPL